MPDAYSSDALIPIFVYGTLRPPRAGTSPSDARFYPDIAPYVISAESAHLPHAVLYDLGAYPGARPGADTVVGDLLRVQPPALVITDRIEGHPRFFVRRRAVIHGADGPVKAWVYWAPEAISTDRPRIPNGDWFER